MAVARGGRLRHFLWPLGHPFWLFRRLREGGLYTQTRDAVWSYVAELRLPHYFRLGLVGFLGTLAWLAVPGLLIAAGGRQPFWESWGACAGDDRSLLALSSGPLRRGGTLSALFSRRAIRERFRRAPGRSRLHFLSFWWRRRSRSTCSRSRWFHATPPGCRAWSSSIFLAPARLLTGWAYARSARREQPRHWLLRWMGRLAIIPAALLYVLVVFLAQYTSWEGRHQPLRPARFLATGTFSEHVTAFSPSESRFPSAWSTSLLFRPSGYETEHLDGFGRRSVSCDGRDASCRNPKPGPSLRNRCPAHRISRNCGIASKNPVRRGSGRDRDLADRSTDFAGGAVVAMAIGFLASCRDCGNSSTPKVVHILPDSGSRREFGPAARSWRPCRHLGPALVRRFVACPYRTTVLFAGDARRPGARASVQPALRRSARI